MASKASTSATPLVSVVTPTYDRRQLLPRLYESLRAQTMRQFEWVVVDDGSTDGTSALLEAWAAEAPFPVVVHRQENMGKHVALNRAFDLARGAYVAMIDSDDTYAPWALERLLALWDEISPAERERFVAVEARCAHPDGTREGDRVPSPHLDSDYFEVWARHGIRGDTVGMLRRAALDGYRFPEEDIGVYVTEAVVWHRLALRYRTRFVDEVLCIKDYQDSGISARPLAARVRDARPQCTYFRDLLAMPRPMPRRIRLNAAANYVRNSLHAGADPRRAWEQAVGHRRALALATPVGIALYGRDRIRLLRAGIE
jgi:glycosyltransferase involved in cell wall biosynthesis